MQTVLLGNSDLRVSRMGYGAWALGKKGWGNVDEQEAQKTVEECVERGVTFFDTAPVYGLGRSESLLGTVLKPVRNQVVLATKCGLRWNDYGYILHDLSRDAILKDIENSLKRLQTDYIDLYQIHWPDKKTPLEETMAVFLELKQQKVIRHIGVSNFKVPLLEEALRLAPVVSVQDLYNFLQRSAEEALLPFCRKQHLGFICYSPLAQGLLTGNIPEDYKLGRQDVRRFNPLFRSRQKLEQSLETVRALPAPPARSALEFLGRQEGVSSVLISTTRRSHLRENLKVFS